MVGVEEFTDRFYLRKCVKMSKSSLDPSTKCGAIIVCKPIEDDYDILIKGINKLPMGVDPNILLTRNQKLKYICHAECTAICQAAQKGIKLLGATLYCTAVDVPTQKIWGGPPCLRCSVHIIQAGIKRVVCYAKNAVPERWKEDMQDSEILLKNSGIEYVDIAL